MAHVSHVLEHTFHNETVRSLTKTMKQATDEQAKGMKYHDLSIESLSILGYADDGFANFDDSVRQFGYAIMLADDTYTVNWISYGSHK